MCPLLLRDVIWWDRMNQKMTVTVYLRMCHCLSLPTDTHLSQHVLTTAVLNCLDASSMLCHVITFTSSMYMHVMRAQYFHNDIFHKNISVVNVNPGGVGIIPWVKQRLHVSISVSISTWNCFSFLHLKGLLMSVSVPVSMKWKSNMQWFRSIHTSVCF